MPTFRMPVPDAPDPELTAKIVEDRKTSTEFDDYLSWMVLRFVPDFQRLSLVDRRRALLETKNEIRRIVDIRLIECICSNDPLFNYNLAPARRGYIKEDTIRKRVRNLVELAYIDQIVHREFIRKKVRGCMQTIESACSSLSA